MKLNLMSYFFVINNQFYLVTSNFKDNKNGVKRKKTVNNLNFTDTH